MFGKVKRWLGIEGVKVTMILPEKVAGDSGVVDGQLRFETMNAQTVTHVRISLFEKYTRGRWKNKLADLYKIAEIELDSDIEIPADTPILIDFALPFTLPKSEMDALGDKNFVMKKIVGAAKTLKNVRSEFYMEVEATVQGTALSPFDKQEIVIV